MKRFLFASIILCLGLLMAIPAVNAQPIREKNKKGHPFLVLNQNQNVLHLKSYAGIGLYYFDGTTVRMSNAKGAPLYYIDVNTVRSVDKSGERFFTSTDSIFVKRVSMAPFFIIWTEEC